MNGKLENYEKNLRSEYASAKNSVLKIGVMPGFGPSLLSISLACHVVRQQGHRTSTLSLIQRIQQH